MQIERQVADPGAQMMKKSPEQSKNGQLDQQAREEIAQFGKGAEGNQAFLEDIQQNGQCEDILVW